MNKTEIVAAISERAEISKKDAEKALKAFTDVVAEELKKNGFSYYETQRSPNCIWFEVSW